MDVSIQEVIAKTLSVTYILKHPPMDRLNG